MITHRCDRCHTKLRPSEQCKCQSAKRYNQYGKDKSERYNADIKSIYMDSRWNTIRERCKTFCNGLDLYELYVNHNIVYGSVAHHIIPLDVSTATAYDINNLIWLSERTHRLIHRLYISEYSLTKNLLKSILEQHRRSDEV